MVKYFKNSFPYSKKTFWSVVFLVMVGCAVAGFIWEQIYGEVIVPDAQVHHGTSFGPWIQIYGFGMLAVFALFWGIRKKPVIAIGGGALLCTLIELATGFFMDHFMNLRTWDYRVGPFSDITLNGYISLGTSLIFAAAIAFILYLYIPMLFKLIKKVGENRIFIIALILGILFLADVFYNDFLSIAFGLFNATNFYAVPV